MTALQCGPSLSSGSPDVYSSVKPVYSFDPLSDSRWDLFLRSRTDSSIFHSTAWLSALRRTYGYQAVAFTTSQPHEELHSAAVFCQVDSWLTGRRLVSVPFADHCAVLIREPDDLQSVCSVVKAQIPKRHLRYIEFRSPHHAPHDLTGAKLEASYALHNLDLGPSIATLFGKLHESSTQRKIRRAEREGLVYREGRSEDLLAAFTRLWMLTRRRHLAPPQPVLWFRNLIECFGESFKIRLASKDGQPVAAIVTLQDQRSMVYKYGCSDPRFHRLGGMHLLLWRSILEAKSEGLKEFDLGRSDLPNHGLIQFKDRWGAEQTRVSYSRMAASAPSRAGLLARRWYKPALMRLLPYVPDRLFRTIGEIGYRHLG